MKKIILTFGLFSLVFFNAQAQDKKNENKSEKTSKPAAKHETAKAAAPTAPAAPVTPAPMVEAAATPQSLADIKFEKYIHDYGTIKYGSDGNCEFKFTNTGKEPLILGNCQGSCGCTVPNCPKEPILPGKTGVIKVHYDTKRPGAINKSISVQSNAKSGTVTLQIKGTVEAEVVEEPFPATKTTNGAPFEKTN